jgi:hypothetical protein
VQQLDWNRLLCLLAFGSLLALACWTGEARVIVGSIVVLAWPFAFIYFGDELGSTLGLKFGLVTRVSDGTLVKIGGWILLAIYLGALLNGLRR